MPVKGSNIRLLKRDPTSDSQLDSFELRPRRTASSSVLQEIAILPSPMFVEAKRKTVPLENFSSEPIRKSAATQRTLAAYHSSDVETLREKLRQKTPPVQVPQLANNRTETGSPKTPKNRLRIFTVESPNMRPRTQLFRTGSVYQGSHRPRTTLPIRRSLSENSFAFAKQSPIRRVEEKMSLRVLGTTKSFHQKP
ncbi:Oidioi.mRNA.OKI2018_I69.PAR.g10928.t1.cds [Oikopleura dioica]|uniref:Oidioi.mRNA.OKI2018_I69.PAR.g10928.t1.cds n=1 Tax=Oikopleura dioica TaxID=34765 RepID=A0ABN7RZJ3_OIKDI|nr:Oidioi.mRNA.OKI2018_I69.PAR.g10928.t1.cds [Oikopleura dioica]